jgi:glycosyltransferase involved in cell wall biosynthesis
LLVCPSRVEPLGNVVIEAWAAGLPVVATASDGPAALIEAGNTGVLVPLPDEPGAVQALAGAIDELCRDRGLRDQLATAGRRAYEAHFTEETVVAAYRQLFDRVAG